MFILKLFFLNFIEQFLVSSLKSLIHIDKHFYRTGRFWREDTDLIHYICSEIWAYGLLLVVLSLLWIEQVGLEERMCR